MTQFQITSPPSRECGQPLHQRRTEDGDPNGDSDSDHDERNQTVAEQSGTGNRRSPGRGPRHDGHDGDDGNGDPEPAPADRFRGELDREHDQPEKRDHCEESRVAKDSLNFAIREREVADHYSGFVGFCGLPDATQTG